MYRQCDEKIYEMYESFINNFIIDKKNYLEDSDEEVFTKQNVEECIERFINNPNESNERFDVKAKKQFENASQGARIVFSHAIWLWGFSVNETKNCNLIFIEKNKKVKQGFANGGQRHLTSKYDEICFVLLLFSALIDICEECEKKPDYNFICKKIEDICRCYKYKEEEECYDDYKNYSVVEKDSGKRPMTEILLYLSNPKKYERIVSYDHKKRIAECFSEFIDVDKNNVLDDKLLEIRRKLSEIIRELELSKKVIDEAFDYYETKRLRLLWDFSSQSGDYDEFQALQFKKNIILYGPPGTSKTYSAMHLAKSFIALNKIKNRSSDLKENLKEYLNNNVGSEKYIRRLQLHSNYSYEQFIVGQTILNGNIKTVKGDFFDFCEKAGKDIENPYILILDEINRVDLARLFGEAFSGIENRGDKIDLPYKDNDGNPLCLCVPKNLYIIGTMNEIDFSLERLDFALRRRFLWFKHNFDADTLRNMVSDEISKKEEDKEEFISRVVKLNDKIKNTQELGEQYEIGHVFFAEINDLSPQFSDKNLYKRSNKKLAMPNGALQVLWKISILPMLEAYLDNIDTQRKKEIIGELEKIYNGQE